MSPQKGERLDQIDTECLKYEASSRHQIGLTRTESHSSKGDTPIVLSNWSDKADEEIRTLDPLLGKEMLYH